MITIVADNEEEFLLFQRRYLDCPANVTYSKCDEYGMKRCLKCIKENDLRFKIEIRE